MTADTSPQKLKMTKPMRKRGRPRKQLTPQQVYTRRLLAERCSAACAAGWQAVSPHLLRAATRGPANVATARQAAIYLLHIVFSANLTSAGKSFGRDRTTARHACSRMEDWRDSAAIDRAFDLLEPALRCWVDAFSAQEKSE